LAKIKLRIGKDEIEIDSRDFYVDNQTIGKVIEDIALHCTNVEEECFLTAS